VLVDFHGKSKTRIRFPDPEPQFFSKLAGRQKINWLVVVVVVVDPWEISRQVTILKLERPNNTSTSTPSANALPPACCRPEISSLMCLQPLQFWSYLLQQM
jgi:hypothetical protein